MRGQNLALRDLLRVLLEWKYKLSPQESQPARRIHTWTPVEDAVGGSNSEPAVRFVKFVGAAIMGVAFKRLQSSKDKAIPAATASIVAAAKAPK